ncbi:NAD-dependent succinate-semialdehyde dehydrogenase [Kangiella sp.]|uniref:NAD-dependent succinate-semialdehyde dehydrogenase n=1 Tax=Kangiella sp. TaxID=1920245 RepID=UPI00199F0588|nr:NAD-dependent succinate-semialdehyde dehydrogenase [Kangiella sp.]MBD3653985.1 NAD-dependent succinate-semialdehyde dehydrogenase [Kangiella sp.]
MNESLVKSRAFINGQWVKTDKRFRVDDPFSQELIVEVSDCGEKEAHAAIDAAHAAFQSWSKTTAQERSNKLLAWYDLIIKNLDDLAEILTTEQGKPLKEAKGEIQYGANYIKWFAEEALRVDGDIIPSPDGNQQIHVIKKPVGVVGIITPWNFPQAMIARKVAPALAAGCTVVIKPAAETPLSALAMAELAQQAGIPDGVINLVPTSEASVIGEALTSSFKVRKISFTGSTKVGKILMSQAAENVQRVTMELGGNAPFIVFEDADIDSAVDGIMASKFRNSGQTCVCANRVFIHESIYHEIVDKLVNKVEALQTGSGLEDDVSITPLINQAGIDKVKRLVQSAKDGGAKVLIGGELSDKHNQIFEPTIMTDVQFDMDIACEEIFGPVLSLIPFSSEESVVEQANATKAGLAAYVYTDDRHRIKRLSEQIESGMIGFNEGIISNHMAPFGGVKESGMGREGSKYGISDYLDIKYLCIN